MRSDRTPRAKIRWLITIGAATLGAGALLSWLGVAPVVKRIWTPSWAIFSSGLVSLLLAGFVAVIDWWGWKRWAFPLIVAGVNPITLYCLWQLAPGFVRQSLKTHFGQQIFESCGLIYAPLFERVSVLLVFWLVLFWMFRKKLFVRI